MLHYSKKKKKKSLIIKKQKSGNLSFKKKLGLSMLTAAASSTAIIKLKNLYNKKINFKENKYILLKIIHLHLIKHLI